MEEKKKPQHELLQPQAPACNTHTTVDLKQRNAHATTVNNRPLSPGHKSNVDP